MKLKKSQIILIFVAALFLGFAGAYAGVEFAQSKDSGMEQGANQITNNGSTNEDTEAPDSSADLNKINQAYSLIKQNYLEEVEDTQLIEGAIEGMLSTLEDPHTSYMDIETVNQFTDQLNPLLRELVQK